jgi:hypothetical protein
MVADLHAASSMKHALLVAFLVALLSGCSPAHEPSSPVVADPPAPQPPPTSTVPSISDLGAHFSDSSCTRAADGLTGRALVITFDYVDGSADLVGGHVLLNRVYNTGRSEWHSAPIPSEVKLIGSQQHGEAEIDDACPLYDNNSSETETLTLFDANGNVSNSLSVTMARPAGAP